MGQTPDEMTASMIANLKEKTGKPLEAWLKVTKKSGLTKHGEIVKLLKSEHGVSHGYANLIAHKTLASDAGSASSGDELISAQYSGAKAELRPIHDALMKKVGAFGKDVEVSPKKSYVSLRRSKQFAIVQPSTKDRVDVGINLKGHPTTERLEASGSFNSMVSHRVRVTNVTQVDTELVGWLRAAYDAS